MKKQTATFWLKLLFVVVGMLVESIWYLPLSILGFVTFAARSHFIFQLWWLLGFGVVRQVVTGGWSWEWFVAGLAAILGGVLWNYVFAQNRKAEVLLGSMFLFFWGLAQPQTNIGGIFWVWLGVLIYVKT